MNIHRGAYASARPALPNTTTAPLGLAPGCTVTVFLTGTVTLAALSTDAAGLFPLANPFVADANGFYEYFYNQAGGDLDEQFSGTGITSPYTLTMVLGLDPTLPALAITVAGLQVSLTAEIAARIAGDLALQRVGVRYPLGGSVQNGLEDASRMDVYDAQVITIDGGLFNGYVLTVFFQGKTDDAGTSFQPVLRNVTNATDAGSGSVSVSTALQTQSFTATIDPAVCQYKLQLEPGNGASFVYGEAYCELSFP